MITYEEANEHLHYNPLTGDLYWKKKQAKWGRPRCMYTPAGSQGSVGYRQLTILGTNYMSHRIAWLLHHGEHPKNQIDHINRNKQDNRIKNLRDVTQEENHANQPVRNKTGFIGVSKVKSGKYATGITIDGKYLHIGTFRTAEEAGRAYDSHVSRFKGPKARRNFGAGI